jgi:hypothetical protein
VGATTVPVGWITYRRSKDARLILWIWNVIGALDLIAAVGLGVLSSLVHSALSSTSQAPRL